MLMTKRIKLPSINELNLKPVDGSSSTVDSIHQSSPQSPHFHSTSNYTGRPILSSTIAQPMPIQPNFRCYPPRPPCLSKHSYQLKYNLPLPSPNIQSVPRFIIDHPNRCYRCGTIDTSQRGRRKNQVVTCKACAPFYFKYTKRQVVSVSLESLNSKLGIVHNPYRHSFGN